MGRDKADLPHPGGGTFLDHAVSRLATIAAQVAVSGRAGRQPEELAIADQMAEQGPAMAVWSAVRYAAQAGFSSVLVTPVDMPDLQSQHLRQLMDSAAIDCPTCASFDGQTPHPLVAIYPVILASELETVARSEQRSLRAWLLHRPVQRVQLPDAAKRDCNTPSNLGDGRHPT